MLKVLGLIIISVIIITLGFIGGVYLGWFPIPKFVINQVAHVKGLSDKEADQMYKAVNVYQILKKSNSQEINDLQKMIINNKIDSAKISNISSKISDETLQKIGDQLEMTPNDFTKVKELIRSNGITDAQLDTLKYIENKYGLSDSLVMKLISN